MQESAYMEASGAMEAPFVKEAEVLRALAHPGRLAILENLRQGPACVCHLTALLGRPQVYISQQLAILKQVGLIESRKDGLFVYYGLPDYGTIAVVDLITRLLGNARPIRPLASARIEGCACPQCDTGPASREATSGH
jgi:DNA-binding transcriptional ArsR family regulator